MATFVDYNGSQGTGTNNADYAFTFKSLASTDIKVEVNNVVKTVTTHYTVESYTTNGGGTIRFTAGNIPSSSSDDIRIFRETNVQTAKVDYQAGSSVKADDLNANQDQLLYAAQEEQNQTIQTYEIKDGAVTNSKLAADSVAGANIQDDVINSQHYIAGSIDLEHMAVNSIDSEQYVDGSIDLVHMSANSVDSDQYVDGSIDLVHMSANSVDSDQYVDGSIDLAHMSANSVDSDQYVDGSIDHVHLAGDAVDGDNIADDSIDSEHYVDGSIDLAHLAAGSVDSSKLTAATVVTNSEQAAASANDTSFFTTSASDARYFNISSGDTIKDGVTFPDNDTTIATTAAINDRIIDLVDDVGGFVPIATELAFPNANPDVNDGTGTLVSIKALSTNYTSSGSGVISVPNGTVGNSTVTINGADNSTTYNSGFGMIVETTAVLNTYTFHRLVPKATEVTTVAGSISNVNTVAGSISNVNTTAGSIANVNTTAGAISNVNTTAGAISNVNTVASNISNVNNFADLYQIDDFSPSAPTTDGGGNSVAEGDLAYDSTANRLKVYTGSAWEDGVAAPSDLLARSGGQMTGNITMSGSQTVDGRDLSADGTKLDGIEASADVTDATNVNAAGAVMNSDLATKGQILVGDGSGDPSALAVGTNTHILTADSSEATGVKWSAAPTGTPEGTAILSTGESGGAKFLREDGDGTCSWQTVPAGGISDVVSDTTPQLGGNLDVNAKNITFGDSAGATDDRLTFGAGTDLSIYHDGTYNYIDSNGQSVTIRNSANNNDHIAHFIAGGAVELRHNGSKKFETTAAGVTVTGAVTATSFSGNGASLTNVAVNTVASDASGYENVYLGSNALEDQTDGERNVAVGHDAGKDITSGVDNVIIGHSAGIALTTGDNCIAIGRRGGWNLTNDHNIAIGNLAGGNGTTSVAIGSSSLTSHTGEGVVALGYQAGKLNTSGTYNTYIGHLAGNGSNNKTGNDNTAVGKAAGANLSDGTKNTCLGSKAGDAITTGDNNTLLGYEATASAVGVDNEVTIGNDNVTKFRVPGINFTVKDTTATEDYVLTLDANGEAGWEVAGGTVANGCIYENDQTISSNYTIAAGKGAHSVGPITNNATVTVNGRWVIS